jgi:glyoxylase-like metal-dependent hydrolase (beta-lactamase superfamily II)
MSELRYQTEVSDFKFGAILLAMEAMLPRFISALPDGVARASLPTPFRVGHVNCYLLTDAPVTLIDPGTLEQGSLEALAAFLREHGLAFTDVEQVVITHAHPDHFGAAAVVAARAGARIVCGGPERGSLVAARDPGAAYVMLRRLGVPEAVAGGLVGSGDRILARVVKWADPSVLFPVYEGDQLRAGGRDFTCLLSSGHADGHLSLWDPRDGTLFSGDHLLPRIIPVPTLQGGAESERRRPFVEYLSGLDRFDALQPELLLPGHGSGFTDVELLTGRLHSHSQARADDIAAILADAPATPYEIARRLQWQPQGARLVMGLANVQGHLDLLAEDGRVVADERDEGVRYGLASQAVGEPEP